MADFSKKTQGLIDRQCRNVERIDFELNKLLSEKYILETYDLFGLKRPKKIKWCVDLLDKDFQQSAGSAWSAGSAGSARSAMSAWSAWSAMSAWSAWSAWSAGSAGSAMSAGSARSAGSAWSAGSARSAGSAWSAGSAGSAWSALDYDFDWYIFEFEYCQNPNEEKLPTKEDLIYLEYCELLMKAKEVGLGYRVEWEDTLYLVPTPIVRINSRNMFHSINSPSIMWKGGQEIFYLNGVMFPKDLWEKTVNRKLSFKEISEIKDIDQRTQAMAFCDVKDFEKLGTVVDTYEKQSLDGGKVTYKLLKIPQGMFTVDAYFAIYNCPSTNKLYLSGIDPEIGKKNDVALSMAWKQGIKKEDFLSAIPLVHES